MLGLLEHRPDAGEQLGRSPAHRATDPARGEFFGGDDLPGEFGEQSREREREGRLPRAVRSRDHRPRRARQGDVEPRGHDGALLPPDRQGGRAQHGIRRRDRSEYGKVDRAARHPHARGGQGVPVLGEHALGRSVGQHSAAGGEYDDPGHEVGPHRRAVLDEHEGRALARHDPLHGDAHLGHSLGVEVGRGFVEQQESRSHRQHPGEGEPLLLPARQRLGGAVEGNGETDGCHGLGHPRGDLRRGDAEVLAPEGDVVADLRQHDARLGILQHQADTAPLRLGRGAVDEDAAGGLPLVAPAEQSRQAREQGRLAGPDAPSSRTRSPGSMTRSTSRVAGSLRPAYRQPQPSTSTRAGPVIRRRDALPGPRRSG